MRPRKNIRFITARVERREALSIPGAQRSRNGRGSEHGALLFFCAARSCTSGIDRRSRTELENSL